ncbi:MAG: DUF2232 domain-containing protein [Clostridiales bacterium]|nr:DUF2232 domain-containing protein [Clostridiales bacterium]
MVGEDIFTYTWEGIRKVFAADNEFITNLLEIYKKIGIIDNKVTSIQLGELVIDNLKLLTPSIIAIFSIICGGGNYILAHRTLKRYNIDLKVVPKFELWKLPRGTTRGFFIIMILAYIGTLAGLENFGIVSATISILFTFIFLIQGLAVIKFFLHRSKMPVFFQYAIMIIAILLLRTPLSFIGILDQVLHFRLRSKEQDNK